MPYLARVVPVVLAVLVVLAVSAAPGQADDLCVTDASAGTAYAPGFNCRTAVVNGYTREYYVYVPAVLNRTPDGVPVVLAYHGSNGSGRRFLLTSGWTAEADSKGFVAVGQSALTYFELKSDGPQTLFNTWADDAAAAEDVDLGIRPPDYPADQHWPADDLAFTDVVIEDLIGLLGGNPLRMYAAGFSNGGVFAMRLALHRTDRIAASASYEGELRTTGVALDPIPVLYVIGTLLDGHVLPLGAEELLAMPAVATKVDTMTSAFGLRSDVYQAREQHWQTTIDFTEPATSGPASRFEILVLDGVQHEWPDATNNPHRFLGPKEFWKFFQSVR